MTAALTAENAVMSPNFLVWKFCGKAQFVRNYGGNCAFPQNFHTRKLGEVTVFYAVNTKKETPPRVYSLGFPKLFKTFTDWSFYHKETIIWRCSIKRMFLKYLQNSQESTCASEFSSDSFVIFLRTLPDDCFLRVTMFYN